MNNVNPNTYEHTQMQEALKRQSDWIRALAKENKDLKAQLIAEEKAHQEAIAQLQQEYTEDREFMTSVIIAALTKLPGRRVTLFQDSPRNAKFSLEPNISNDMIVILKAIL